MSRALSPKKLLRSKWTAVKPENKEKHFVVVEVDHDDSGTVILCVLEAVYTQRSYAIDWRDLNDSRTWRAGWL
ncbi:MAG: hypothetical protein DHS20C11_05550 [Lysobacteraceae bacterium]|nr:MAG: hypothetical protein DHS20C11_05550 [Xanthomonadaceae bacterium]